MAPAISVIVRTLGSRWLADALESLAAQTRRDFEVVVVDMSDGRNHAILERFAARLPSLRVLALPRRSRPKALNDGIAAACAPLIAILDDDNLYDPPHLETLVVGLQNTGAAYVYTGVRHATYSTSGEWMACHETGRPFSFDDLLHQNFIYATGSAFRKSLWEELGGYDERFAVLEDWEFLIRAAQAARIEFLGGVSGESRKLTGVVGASSFEQDLPLARRCYMGIRWKHRRLYLARHRAAGKSLLPILARGWRLFAGLSTWFMHNLRDARRSR